ncbi:MAG TPA: DUF1499 domain-containing protein [Planctomycetota bacterium]|nr:DUF1499 domain-containing protein [Planctomycetota bacterium]
MPPTRNSRAFLIDGIVLLSLKTFFELTLVTMAVLSLGVLAMDNRSPVEFRLEILGIAAASSGIMTIGMVLAHAICVLKSPYRHAPNAMGVKHARQLVIDADFDETFRRCLQAIAGMKGARLRESNPQEGSIRAVARMSWTSFGQRVTILAARVEKDRTAVEVRCVPRLITNTVDCGVGLERIEAICQSILRVRSQRPRSTGG